MKLFLFVYTLTFASAILAAPTLPTPTELAADFSDLLNQIFNFTDLEFPSLSDIASSISSGPCPETFELPESLKLDQFLGTWYEIKRTNRIFENGQRCVQANYRLDQSTGNVIVNNSGINMVNKHVFNVGTAKLTEKSNVFGVKFFPLSPTAQYWVLDTDYVDYALVVSCNDIFGLFNINDAWILSRKSTLDESTIKRLESKTESVGISASRYISTDQNCNN